MNTSKISWLIIGLFSLTIRSAWSGPDDTSIIKTISDMSKSYADFSKTRDVQSVLKFFTKDYTEIYDGKLDSLKGIEKKLRDLEEQMTHLSKEQMSITSISYKSYKLTDLKAQVVGTVGWGICDYSVKLDIGGQVLDMEQGKCSFICKKVGTSWLIEHVHYSTRRPAQTEEQEEPQK